MEKLTPRGPSGHPDQVTVLPSPWASLRVGLGLREFQEADTAETMVIVGRAWGPGLGSLPRERPGGDQRR